MGAAGVSLTYSSYLKLDELLDLQQLDRLEEPSIYQSFLRYLRACGYAIPGDVLATRGDAPPPEGQEIRDQLIRIYREDDRLTQVCERPVDLDEGLQEWRYRSSL